MMVENALAEHPEVADSAVIGVPDPDYWERLGVFVVPRSRASIEESSLREYLRDNVSRFEQPRDIKIVERIPRSIHVSAMWRLNPALGDVAW